MRSPHKSAGAPLTHRLSEGFRAAVKKGPANAAKMDVAAKVGECAADIRRHPQSSADTQMAQINR